MKDREEQFHQEYLGSFPPPDLEQELYTKAWTLYYRAADAIGSTTAYQMYLSCYKKPTDADGLSKWKAAQREAQDVIQAERKAKGLTSDKH